MVRYNYDVGDEVFKREDRRGNHLYINITEANKIINLTNLGYSDNKIINKVKLSNPKGSSSTVRTFIKNFKAGNINMPENAPVPVRTFETMTDSDRLNNLEKRVDELEKKVNAGFIDKVKSWI